MMKSKKTDAGYFLQLNKGDEVMESLTAFAKEQGITTGFFTGIGAFRDMTVAYRDTETQTYPSQEFLGTYEVLSCKGNFALKDGEPFVHCHIVFADTNFRAHGGHLLKATVAVIGEFQINEADTEIHRELDEATGLHIWDLE